MRAKIITGILLAFLCCGLVRATNGIQPENSDDDGLFIPTVDNAWNTGSAWNDNDSDGNSWTTPKKSSANKNRRTKKVSRKAATVVPAESQETAKASGSEWFSKPDQPGIVALIVLGGAAVVLIPALLVIRRMRARGDRYYMGEVSLHQPGRHRSSVPTVLAASLARTRHDAVGNATHNEESQKTRRAAA